MKAVATTSLLLIFSASVVSLTTDQASAQGTRQVSRQSQQASSPRSNGGGVAIVDVSLIFKNHARFKATMDAMKKEVEQYEEQLRSRHQALSKERDRLNQYRPGSNEYETLERSLADKAAKLQVDTQLKKKEFLQRESKVYYTVYQEVSGAVKAFADQAGIDLVLRYNGETINPEDRTSVLQGVNKALVYHRGDLDITREILDRLNRQQQRQANSRPRQAPRR